MSESKGAESTLRLWRLVKARHAATAFDGEGAFRYGGRWNRRGQRVVYASGSLALAVLEVLVHLDPAASLPELCAFPIDLPRRRLQIEPFSELDHVSGNLPWSLARTREWGDTWCREGQQPALRIPSALVPTESNYLLQPQHPDFAQVKIGGPQAFTLDTWLIGAALPA